MLVVVNPAATRTFPTLSLRNYPKMPEPIPRRLLGCTWSFLPPGLRPSPCRNWVGARDIPSTVSEGSLISRLQYSFPSFWPPSLLAAQTVPTLGASPRPPRLLHPSRTWVVAAPCIGYANHPNRPIGDVETSTPQVSQPCRLLLPHPAQPGKLPCGNPTGQNRSPCGSNVS